MTDENFAPIAKMTFVLLLIAIASIHRWHIYQMDINNALSNGDLVEEVYMTPLPTLAHPHYFYHLRKVLHGLI